jgi:hypothetical protein
MLHLKVAILDRKISIENKFDLSIGAKRGKRTKLCMRAAINFYKKEV